MINGKTFLILILIKLKIDDEVISCYLHFDIPTRQRVNTALY